MVMEGPVMAPSAGEMLKIWGAVVSLNKGRAKDFLGAGEVEITGFAGKLLAAWLLAAWLPVRLEATFGAAVLGAAPGEGPSGAAPEA